MKIDYSKFERGINFCADVIIEDGGSEKTIEAQIQPDKKHEIPESGKETLEFFLDNYSEYKGNTTRPAANASAHHLLASFPSYYPNSP